MNARGFTLLELVLASVIGSVIIVAAIGMFATLDSSERRGATRSDESWQLARLQLVMRRSFGTLVMSSQPDTRESSGISLRNTDDDAEADEVEEDDDIGPLRFGLADDPLAGSVPIWKQRARTLHMGRPRSAQSLEVVLTQAPIRGIHNVSGAFRRVSRTTGNQQISRVGDDGGFRGVFELRPSHRIDKPGVMGRDAQSRDDRIAELSGQRPQSWTLWWRPVDPTVQVDPLAASADAVVVATNLVRCDWQVFEVDHWSDQYVAVFATDLPAYVKMQVETTSGLAGEWLFEIGWTVGMTAEEIAEQEAAAAAAALNASTLGGGDGTGDRAGAGLNGRRGQRAGRGGGRRRPNRDTDAQPSRDQPRQVSPTDRPRRLTDRPPRFGPGGGDGRNGGGGGGGGSRDGGGGR